MDNSLYYQILRNIFYFWSRLLHLKANPIQLSQIVVGAEYFPPEITMQMLSGRKYSAPTVLNEVAVLFGHGFHLKILCILQDILQVPSKIYLLCQRRYTYFTNEVYLQ